MQTNTVQSDLHLAPFISTVGIHVLNLHQSAPVKLKYPDLWFYNQAITTMNFNQEL